MDDRKGADAPRGPRPVAVGALVFGALALAGALLGPLWWLLAPDRARGTALGDGEVFTGTTEALFAGEGSFVLITALAGLLSGYAVYMVQFPLTRGRPRDLRLWCLLAGFLGSVAGTLLTWRVGMLLDAPLHTALARARPGDEVTVGLRLDATAFLVAWPFVFVLQYALLDLISMVRRDLPGVPRSAPAGAAPPADAPPAPRPGPFPVGEGPDRPAS
ncbi:hypothetical protein SUDANB121_01464 [Nocardiopsis dassonvillei]|uniref:hypothetical protein n=1 Tax=Nocardiopsis dassonvillei TaxID=2014 RepID=UPI003F56EC6F